MDIFVVGCTSIGMPTKRYGVNHESPSVERTAEGRRLVVAAEVSAPADRAWDLLVDTARWTEWGPSISGVESDHRRVRSGTKGRVRVAEIWVPFVVDSCADRRWTWRIAGVPATGHSVRERGARRCRVAFEIPLAAGWYAPVCRSALDRIAAALDG
ncbi:SRPBCC family protein [Haloferacaceae archaeon DSL9]